MALYGNRLTKESAVGYKIGSAIPPLPHTLSPAPKGEKVSISKQPRWIDLYEDFLAETNAEKLRTCLAPLELSILERLQHLNGTPAAHEELLAIRMATDKLLEIKTTKLGFPPLPMVRAG